MKRSTDNLRMRDTAPMISLLVSALGNDTATLKNNCSNNQNHINNKQQQQTTTANNNNNNNNDSHHTL